MRLPISSIRCRSSGARRAFYRVQSVPELGQAVLRTDAIVPSAPLTSPPSRSGPRRAGTRRSSHGRPSRAARPQGPRRSWAIASRTAEPAAHFEASYDVLGTGHPIVTSSLDPAECRRHSSIQIADDPGPSSSRPRQPRGQVDADVADRGHRPSRHPPAATAPGTDGVEGDEEQRHRRHEGCQRCEPEAHQRSGAERRGHAGSCGCGARQGAARLAGVGPPGSPLRSTPRSTPPRSPRRE